MTRLFLDLYLGRKMWGLYNRAQALLDGNVRPLNEYSIEEVYRVMEVHGQRLPARIRIATYSDPAVTRSKVAILL